MKAQRSRTGVAWLTLLLLVGATALAMWLRIPKALLDVVVVAALLGKARIVGLDFLGLRSAPAGWRLSIGSGIAVVAGLALALSV